MPEPERKPESAASYEAASVVRDALKLRDLWSAELEAAWADASRSFPHVDARTMQMLRSAFEKGYRDVQQSPRLLVIVPPKRTPEPPPKLADP